MKLDGNELAAYIKVRHAQEVRALAVQPKIVIIMHPEAGRAIRTYVEQAKHGYATDIGAAFELREVALDTTGLIELIETLNKDETVHGILLQLPYKGIDQEAVLAAVAPHKDIDGLGPEAHYEMPTPKAILWLLAAFNIDYKDKKVVVVGQGRLVGKPLADMLEVSGVSVTRCDKSTEDLPAITRQADILISATGQSHLITPGMVKPGAVIIGAGTSESGPGKGDLDTALYSDDSLKIARNTGGVGPVTVAALFDNLLQAAQR